MGKVKSMSWPFCPCPILGWQAPPACPMELFSKAGAEFWRNCEAKSCEWGWCCACAAALTNNDVRACCIDRKLCMAATACEKAAAAEGFKSLLPPLLGLPADSGVMGGLCPDSAVAVSEPSSSPLLLLWSLHYVKQKIHGCSSFFFKYYLLWCIHFWRSSDPPSWTSTTSMRL